jgi:antitoxin (DNA-binding transcriptional repressor) of toxin-antitoxin stability system
MNRRVGVAELKAQLSKHLRSVKKGRSITVLDRDTPVATLSPVLPDAGFALRPASASGGLKKLQLPRPLKKKPDIDLLLAEERKDRF